MQTKNNREELLVHKISNRREKKTFKVIMLQGFLYLKSNKLKRKQNQGKKKKRVKNEIR